MAQPKLTATGGTLKLNTTGQAPSNPAPESETSCMDTSADDAAVLVLPERQGPIASTEPLTAEFFKNLIGENTRTVTEKIQTLSEDLLTLSRTVDANKDGIRKATTEIEKQADVISEQKAMLLELGERVSLLENRGSSRAPGGTGPVGKSLDYLRARRAVRIWPVDRTSEEALWRGTGEFIHTALKISEDEVSPDDIESIVTVPDPRLPIGNLHDEAIVTFYCARKRDSLLANAANLASFRDSAGRPTAGVRLGFPVELDDTFRLLSRFGTRLRARHGEGTKRHVKFDDHESSLIMNIKLPGDEQWSRVTPSMAREDLAKTTREEAATIMKRISSNAPGPRQRLAAPAGNEVRAQRDGATGSSLELGNQALMAARTVPNYGSQADSRTTAPRTTTTVTGPSSQSGPKPRRDWAPRNTGKR